MVAEARISKSFAFGKFLSCQPAIGGEGIIKFVAVKLFLGRSQNGVGRRKLKTTDTLKVIDDLLLFVSQLGRIVDMLPGTTAADAEVGAERF